MGELSNGCHQNFSEGGKYPLGKYFELSSQVPPLRFSSVFLGRGREGPPCPASPRVLSEEMARSRNMNERREFWGKVFQAGRSQEESCAGVKQRNVCSELEAVTSVHSS